MTIASEIQRIKTNIENAYDALENLGATMPATEDTDHLVGTINTISGGGGDEISAVNKSGSAVTAGEKVWVELKDTYISDFTTFGDPSIDMTNGIMSSNSVNKLIYKNIDNTTATTRTIQIRVKFSSVSYVPNAYPMCRFMMNDYQSNFYGLVAILAYSGNYYWWFDKYQSGSEPRIKGFPASLAGIQEDTYYYLKLEMTSSTATSYYSTDGASWTQVDSISISSINTYADASHKVFSLGGLDGTVIPTYDLTKCEYSVDGSLVWTPFSYEGERYEIQDFYSKEEFTVEGSPTITNKVASGFSTSNFLKLKDAFDPQSRTWEVLCKITTGSSVSTQQNIFKSGISAPAAAGRFGVGFEINTSHFRISASSNGTAWDLAHDVEGTYTILTNTTYWVKLGWSGTQYYLEYSLDGQNFTRDITISSSTAVYGLLGVTLLGLNWWNEAYQAPFLGSIDLSETYINIRGSLWWSAYGSGVTLDTLTGVANGNIAVDATGTVKTILP